MKPIIFYVDDAPNNLTVFESELEDNWDVRTFANPLEALAALSKIAPAVIVSDQRMPGMNGVDYLELAAKLHPNAVRIIVTGYSDEQLVIDSVRKAKVFDYIRKPWRDDELEASMCRAFEYFKKTEEVRLLHEELQLKNTTLSKLTEELRQSVDQEKTARLSLESWIHPTALKIAQDKTLNFPLVRDLVGITFDVIGGSRFHDAKIEGVPLITRIIEEFSKILLKYGGFREGAPGDSVYGHFGLDDSGGDPFVRALAAAQEFRVGLRGLSNLHGSSAECGIALHFMKDSKIEIHKAEVQSANGVIVQKSIGTSSLSVDLLHRLEKEVHTLPGSNIILSGDFLARLKNPPGRLVSLGSRTLRGQSQAVEMYLLPSDKLSEVDLAAILKCVGEGEVLAAA